MFGGGKIFNLLYVLTKNFPSTTKFGGAQNQFGGNAPECHPRLRACASVMLTNPKRGKNQSSDQATKTQIQRYNMYLLDV